MSSPSSDPLNSEPEPRSKPSPYCGRVDDHLPHPWRGVYGEHQCPGPPIMTRAEMQAVGRA